MRRLGAVASIVLVFVLVLATAARAQQPTVESLRWLAGCWASESREAGSGEVWMPPAGGTMLGISRTLSGGRAVAQEFVQIRALESGQLAYVARPSGQAEAAFTLLRIGEREVVFENLEHDFPQRVIYRLEEKGALRARIEGVQDGKLSGVDFPMQRVDCETWKPAAGVAGPSRTVVIPAGSERAYDEYRYAPAVRVGDTVILSGIPAGGDGDYQAKVRRMFERARAVLEAAGSSLADVVELTSFHTEATDTESFQREFALLLEVHAEFFPKDKPAWTAVGTTALLAPGAPVEMRFVAVVGSGRRVEESRSPKGH